MCIAGSAFAEDAGNIVSNDVLSVTVPQEVLDICDIETDDSSISFYEKISHESFDGGFVGSISTFENVSDYADIPNYERGGEIDYSDGSKLDIALVYPSDVQYDMESEDSTENYNMLREHFEQIALTIVPAGEGVFVPQDEIDTTGIYDEILDRLAADLTDRKDRDELEADDFSYVYAYTYDLEDTDPLDETGYAFIDVNRDGYKELVIGSVGAPFFYDMYVPVNGEPVHIFTGGERSSYNLVGTEGSTLYVCNNASGGAAYSEITYSYLQPNEPEPLSQVRFIIDAEKDEENPWFIDYGIEGEEPEKVTEDDWNLRMSNYGETIDPHFVSLSER